MVIVGLVNLAFLYAAGRRHRELQRSRADHPAARSHANGADSDAASNGSSGEPAQRPAITFEAERKPSRIHRSLREIVECAAAADTDSIPTELSGDTASLVESHCSKAVSAKRYRSGLLLEHGDESIYLAIVLWDGRSKTPADRTVDRLVREFADSGCPTMAVLTDAPRSHCRTDWKIDGDPPYVIPAEGIELLIEGLERLDKT